MHHFFADSGLRGKPLGLTSTEYFHQNGIPFGVS